jgi:hypothetical protein
MSESAADAEFGEVVSPDSRMLSSVDLTSLAVSNFIDGFRLSFVDGGQFGSGLAIGFEKFIKLRVYRKRVPPVRSLDEQRHSPYNQSGNRMPVERARLLPKPKHSVEDNDDKGRRMAGEVSDSGSPLSWRHQRCSQ